ncbi:hypothetical protein [Streptacidiphilus monticola]|uniref:Uncharacterized protein n=1 Tax=Streptacidiphilus monticola TaxID=2161674 RepID=A0ABW1FXW7_9ACTN
MTVRATRALLGGAGVALLGFGVHGLLTDAQIHDPVDVALWGLGALVLHDGLWLPAVCVVGALLTRRHPLLRGALLVAASLLAVGLPAVLRAGTDHGNASLLPLPYLRNLLVLVGGVGVVAAVPAAASAAARRRAARRGREPRRRSAGPKSGAGS